MFKLAVLISVVVLLILGAVFLFLGVEKTINAAITNIINNSLLSLGINRLRIERSISKMTIEEKIGQMMMVNIPSYKLSEETTGWLKTYHFGSVILLGKNVESEAETKDLIKQIHQLSPVSEIPIFVAVDQEGGEVSRFKFPGMELTSQRDIHNGNQAFQVAYKRGEELKSLGVDIIFSPVLDVVVSPEDFMYPRAFIGDEKVVGDLGEAMISGYQASGITATAKHFPGHGNTGVDSHKSLPTINFNDTDWQKHILPFRGAITSGVKIIMIGHLRFPAIDSIYPASLSSIITTDFLRNKLGYDGIIITDDLGMGAIMNSYSLPEAAILAIKAGADIVLMARDKRDYEVVYRAIKDAVINKEVPEGRLNESVRRILRLKINA